MSFCRWMTFALLSVCTSACLDAERPCRYVVEQSEVDGDGDGLVDRLFTVNYDEGGLTGLAETYEGEDLELLMSRVHLTLNNARLPITEEIDQPADGSIDRRISYAYGEHDLWTERREDTDADGEDDSSITRTFNEDGNDLVWEGDVDNDGTVDTRITYTYDAEGRPVRREGYDAVAGAIVSIHTTNYDTPGVAFVERDEGADGTIDYRGWRYLDSEGHTLVDETDNDADGDLDYRYTYTYDADWNIIVNLTDGIYEGEVTLSIRTTYTYDSHGNRLVREVDQGDDGVINSRVVTSWQCL